MTILGLWMTWLCWNFVIIFSDMLGDFSTIYYVIVDSRKVSCWQLTLAPKTYFSMFTTWPYTTKNLAWRPRQLEKLTNVSNRMSMTTSQLQSLTMATNREPFSGSWDMFMVKSHTFSLSITFSARTESSSRRRPPLPPQQEETQTASTLRIKNFGFVWKTYQNWLLFSLIVTCVLFSVFHWSFFFNTIFFRSVM